MFRFHAKFLTQKPTAPHARCGVPTRQAVPQLSSYALQFPTVMFHADKYAPFRCLP
jgi:hypothetical protein